MQKQAELLHPKDDVNNFPLDSISLRSYFVLYHTFIMKCKKFDLNFTVIYVCGEMLIFATFFKIVININV